MTIACRQTVFMIHRTWAGLTSVRVGHNEQTVHQLIYQDLLDVSDPKDGDTVPGSVADVAAAITPTRKEGPYRAAWTLAWDDVSFVIEEVEVLIHTRS